MKIQAESQNIGAFPKLGGFPKYRRIYCAYQKSRHPSCVPIRKLGAQTMRLLTIWARQNLQLLTSSKSG